jgi:hypothetical protein
MLKKRIVPDYTTNKDRVSILPFAALTHKLASEGELKSCNDSVSLLVKNEKCACEEYRIHSALLFGCSLGTVHGCVPVGANGHSPLLKFGTDPRFMIGLTD